MRVPFRDLGGADLVRWRLGMAHHAPFFVALDERPRRQVEADCLERLGSDHHPLVRSIIVLSAIVP